MAHAEICPVCKGSGEVYPPNINTPKTCHGCNGKGWVEVGDTIPAFPSPVIPAPIPNPRLYEPIWPYISHWYEWRITL